MLRALAGARLNPAIFKIASGSLALQVAFAGLGLVTNLLLASVLTTTDFGTYNYAQSWLNLLLLPAMLGFNVLLIRTFSAYRAQASWGLMRGIVRFSLALTLAISMLVIAGGGVINQLSADAVTARMQTGYLGIEATPQLLAVARVQRALWLALLLVPIAAYLRISGAALQGLQHVVRSQVATTLLRPLLLIALVGSASLWLDRRLSPDAAIALNLLSAALALTYNIYFLRRLIPPPMRQVQAAYQPHYWVISAFPLFLSSGLRAANAQTPNILLGNLVGLEPVGFYSVALMGSSMVALVLTAANVLVAPRIAELYTRGEIEKLQAMLVKSARGIMLVSLPVAAALIVFGDVFLRLFGREFVQAHAALGILSLGQFVSAAFGPVGFVLSMTGHERDTMLGVGISAAINLGLSLLLIPRWGLEGAAVATATSTVLWNVALAGFIWRRLRIQTTALGRIGFWG